MKLSRQHVINCSFSSWYRTFRDSTVSSRIIPLPVEFIDYLNADGIVLPDSCPQPSAHYTCGGESDSDLSDEWNNADEQLEDAAQVAPSFPELEEDIARCIEELGGYVFPKLNWSSPQDAAWISHNKTLRCSNFEEIVLLLKSSDRISHDLTKPFEGCQDLIEDFNSYELVLRKWDDISGGMEYRCFIRFGNIIAISQRDISNYYPFMQNAKEEICHDIMEFFNRKIKSNFAEESYVMDVCRRGKGKVTVVDFNPFNYITDSSLFDWNDLITDKPLAGSIIGSIIERPSDTTNSDIQTVIFRCIGDACGIAPSPYQASKLPVEAVGISGSDATNRIVEYLKYKSQQMERDDND